VVGSIGSSSSTDQEDDSGEWNVRDACRESAESESNDNVWFRGLFTETDFEDLYPIKSRFLRQLSALVDQKQAIVADAELSDEGRTDALRSLVIETESGHRCSLAELSLTFQLNPSSGNYGYSAVDLVPDGGNVEVTVDNVDEYVRLCREFYLYTGIRRQVNAFRTGFNRVFPIDTLQSFSAEELRLLLCGEQYPEWTREEIVQFTEPKLGYNRDSRTFLDLVSVLLDMDGEERRSFLQFTTGCSSLPPGGLANLHPRLTVVRKVDAGDGSYPSVNTCVHYLKLPEYSSKEVMRERLLAATRERGFHLN
jgi:E3 ubiquitin-protein ligase HECTD1